jgi:hypothetical protein
MNNPAGWYPQADGQQRYWDGERWTEHFAPRVLPVTPPAGARRNWFLRHKILTGIGAFLLLGMISGLANGGDSTPKSGPAVAVQPAAEPVATSEAANEAAAAAAAAEQVAADKVAADTAAADQAAADKVAAKKAAADKAAAKAAAAPQLGKTVRDGKFAFTVTAVKCGIAQVGTNKYLTQKAQGQYCRASLRVENIGNEAQTMSASNQYLFDTKGRKFSADATANIYDDSAKLMFEEINPGNSLKGYVYFDVPQGTKVSKLELHDSMFSDGIGVRL